MNRYVAEVLAMSAVVASGAKDMSQDLENSAVEKWEKSKQLPRKAKKLMRKDALLDMQFAQMSNDFASNLGF